MALLGNPFVGNVPKQMNTGELIQALRVDIAGELEAILGYEAHVMATDDQRVKKVLSHIADEERQHVGELQQLLYLLSPNDMEKNGEGKAGGCSAAAVQLSGRHAIRKTRRRSERSRRVLFQAALSGRTRLLEPFMSQTVSIYKSLLIDAQDMVF